jgi:hypothetical protein
LTFLAVNSGPLSLRIYPKQDANSKGGDSEELKKVKENMIMLAKKIEELEGMINGAKQAKMSFDLARLEYQKQRIIRDEKRETLKRIENQIESLKVMMYEKSESGKESIPAGMVGTWYFDNAGGDDEQMAIFGDGKVVVLYSNGHKDETFYKGGFIELAEYDNIKGKIVLKDKDTLLQYFNYNQEEQLGKAWKRVSDKLQTELLKPLTK